MSSGIKFPIPDSLYKYNKYIINLRNVGSFAFDVITKKKPACAVDSV